MSLMFIEAGAGTNRQVEPVADGRRNGDVAAASGKPRNKEKMIRSALEAIDPAALDDENWYKIGAALHAWSEGKNTGFELWNTWNQRDTARFNAEVVISAWNHLDANRPEGIDIGTLMSMALDRGWQGVERKPPISLYADNLEKILPEVVCVGSKWYVAENGVYRLTDMAQFRPQAQGLLLPSQESSGLAMRVLSTIEGRRQKLPSALKSFAVIAEGGAILLNCRNGILRVTGNAVELLPHNNKFLFTRQIAAAYDPAAKSDCFERVVAEALPDAEDQNLFRSFAGYTLMPNCDLHAALICHGVAGSGKSTLWAAISSALGSDLVLNISLRQLCGGRGYSLPKVRHAALNLGNEAPSGELDQTDMLKSLICGEPVEVRSIFSRPEKMENYSAKFVFLSNHLPHFKHGTDAELRRLRLLQFDHKPEKTDPTLLPNLVSEKDGILARAMVPALQLLLREPVMPEGGIASRAVKGRFALENDPLAAFLGQCCDIGPELHEAKARLYRAFEEWSKYKDVAPGLQTAEHFFRQLRSRYTELQDYRPTVGRDRPHCLRGLRLKPGVPVTTTSELDKSSSRQLRVTSTAK